MREADPTFEMHCSGPMRPLVLASASPRRKQLLEGLGLRFVVDPSDAPETVDPHAPVDRVVLELATVKARAVAPRHPDALVIAADTLVALDGQIFGKPADRDDARSMLSALSGRVHRVSTGLVLLDARTGALDSRIVETDVRFRPLDAAEVEAYLETPEPYDKAGAYASQGIASVFVERIDGDYFSVVGLPLSALDGLLRAAGCCVICRRLREGAAAD